MVGDGVDEFLVAEEVGGVPCCPDTPEPGTGEFEGNTVASEDFIKASRFSGRPLECVKYSLCPEENQMAFGRMVNRRYESKVGSGVGEASRIVRIGGFFFSKGGTSGCICEVDRSPSSKGEGVEIYASAFLIASDKLAGGSDEGFTLLVLLCSWVLSHKHHRRGRWRGRKGVLNPEGR